MGIDPIWRWRHAFAWVPAAIVITTSAMLASTTSEATAPSGRPGSSAPKPQRPANINPDKTPVTDPAKIKTQPAVPLTLQQRRDQATSWAAHDPNSRVVCFNADGTVAGMAELDRVDPAAPLSPANAASVCTNAAPGSHPTVH